MDHVIEFSDEIGGGENKCVIDLLYFRNGFLIVFE